MSHLILVEDDGSLRETLRRTFERRGHQVKEAGDLASLSGWLDGQETFDWAVVDLGLPDGSGLDAVSALRSSNPENTNRRPLTSNGFTGPMVSMYTTSRYLAARRCVPSFFRNAGFRFIFALVQIRQSRRAGVCVKL